MRLTIDNLDGLGAVDYSSALDASGPLKIERTLNAPSRCEGLLALGGGLATPVRRGRVAVSDENGMVLFTGYIATEPQAIYAGVGLAGPVYRTAFSAVSDEWLLDKQTVLFGGGLAQAGGAVFNALTQRVGGAGLSTSGVQSGRAVGVFVPEQGANWSENAGTVANTTYSAYRAVNGALSLQPAGSVVHAFSDGDGTLQVAALKLAAVKELANDVTVSGAIEPSAYVTEVFAGDGTTSVFQLTETPFVPSHAANKTYVLNDSFNTGVFNPAVWTLTDPGSHLGFGANGLFMSGGNGFDGQTKLTAVDAVEMGGTLVVETGSLQLDPASDGVLCGMYQGPVTRTNCFAGWNVRQSAGQTIVTPYVNGTEVGTSYTILTGHRYTLRMRLHCAETQRVMQTYYAMVDGAVEAFGGGLVAAPMQAVFELIDLGVSSNTPTTVLYDTAVTGPIASTPASCTFAAVDAVQMFGSMGYCRVTQTGSAWVVSTLQNGQPFTRMVGATGEGLDCKTNNTGGTTTVTFYAGRIPVAGELVTVTYRGRQRSVARLEDPASVAAEAEGNAAGSALGTASGSAAWLGKVVRPAARSTVDCESAAQAILSFAASRAAALAGSYTAVNPQRDADIWPGDVLALTANGTTTKVLVRQVAIADSTAAPEVLTYKIAFANDWAEGLGLKLSEQVAVDAVLPQVALDGPSLVLPSLQQMTVVSVTEAALLIDAGTAAPSGGGFEVRRREGDFGPFVDQDLVLRSPVRSFMIPREAQVEQYFMRMYDGSVPPVYSRFSSAVLTHVPVG